MFHDDKNNEKNYSLKDNLKKSLKYAKKRKKEFLLYFIGNLFLCIIGGIAPLVSAKQLLFLTDGILGKFLWISIFVFSIEITRNFSGYLTRKYSQIFAREVLKDIQIDMAKEVLRIETADLDKKSSGVIINRLTNDTSKIADIFLELNWSITDVITNTGILFAIFVINKYIFLFYVFSIFLIFFLERKRINIRNEMDKKYRKTAEKTTGLAGELVRGVRDIKVLNAGKSFLKNINEKITLLNEQRYQMIRTNRSFRLLIDCIRDILDLALIVIFIYMIKIDMITISSVVIIYMYRGRVFNLLSYFSDMLDYIKDFNLSAGRVFEVIDSDEFRKESFGTGKIEKVKGDFEFKDVHFGYEDKQEVLKGISFKIKHNSTVSFVGKSGAGKSTIFSLLAKMYHAKSGEILIDGKNIDTLDEDSIRGNISIITQNPYIFNMTIRENLEIVKDGLTEEEMIKACKLACLHDFIMSLPDGYDTMVGEGGLTLSGGQKQRLAIARAMVQKTEIILFDEATSALDNETQQSIQEAINNMKNKYTILIIAHRLSTVINSDEIMLIEDGKVTCAGSHEELLKSSKDYKQLYNLELKKNKTTS